MRRMEDGYMHRRMRKNKDMQGNNLDTPTIHGPQSLPDFLAVDVSSDRQMGVWFRSGNGGGNALTCFIVAGNERHRRPFANCRVDFQGLCVPPPAQTKPASARYLKLNAPHVAHKVSQVYLDVTPNPSWDMTPTLFGHLVAQCVYRANKTLQAEVQEKARFVWL